MGTTQSKRGEEGGGKEGEANELNLEDVPWSPMNFADAPNISAPSSSSTPSPASSGGGFKNYIARLGLLSSSSSAAAAAPPTSNDNNTSTATPGLGSWSSSASTLKSWTGLDTEGIEQAQAKPFFDFGLTYYQRITGFVICMLFGSVCSFLSTLYIPTLVLYPAKFAVLYTLGNIASLGSMGFVIGFQQQVKSMCTESRRVVSSVYVLCLCISLFSALYLQSAPLTLVSIGAQSAACVWYCLSFIPYSQQIVGNCLKSIGGRCVNCVRGGGGGGGVALSSV